MACGDPIPSADVRANFTSQISSGIVWTSFGICPHDTAVTLVKFLAYVLAFVVAYRVFEPSRRRITLIQALITLGVFDAGYGIFEYLAGPPPVR